MWTFQKVDFTRPKGDDFLLVVNLVWDFVMGYVGPFKTEQGAPNPFRTEQICACVGDLYSTQLTKKVITGRKVNGPWRELRRWVGPTSKVRALGGRGGEVSWEPQPTGLWVWEQGQRLAPKPSVLSARLAQEDWGVSSFSLVVRPLPVLLSVPELCCGKESGTLMGT